MVNSSMMVIGFLEAYNFTTSNTIPSIHSYPNFSCPGIPALENPLESSRYHFSLSVLTYTIYQLIMVHSLLFLWKESHRKVHASYCYDWVKISIVYIEELSELINKMLQLFIQNRWSASFIWDSLVYFQHNNCNPGNIW